MRTAPSDREHATLLLGDYLTTLALGVEKLFAFHGFYGDRACGRFFTFFDEQRPRRAAAAFATLSHLVTGRVATFPDPADSLPEVHALLAGTADTIWVLSPSSESPYSVSIADGAEVFSQWGARLTLPGATRFTPPTNEFSYLRVSRAGFEITY
jgi:hypothetical protein